MRQQITKKLTVMILFLLLIQVCFAADIRIYIGRTIKPVLIEDDKGGFYGYDFDVLQEMVKRAGHNLVIVKKMVPWIRTLNDLENGQTDVIIMASYTDERAEYAWFDIKYRSEYLTLYIKKGNRRKYNLKNIEDLLDSNFILGTALGTSYGDKVDTIIERMGKRVQAAPGEDAEVKNRKKLLSGRIDGYLGYPLWETFSLERDGLEDKIETYSGFKQVKTGDLYFMFSKLSVSRSTMEDLKKAYKEMEQDGTINKIKDKYTRMFGIEKW